MLTPPEQRDRPALSRDERNALIVAVDSSVRRAWPELRGQLEGGFQWPDAVLTDAISRAIDGFFDERHP